MMSWFVAATGKMTAQKWCPNNTGEYLGWNWNFPFDKNSLLVRVEALYQNTTEAYTWIQLFMVIMKC